VIRYWHGCVGDPQANSPLRWIAITRLRNDSCTRAYKARRLVEGHSRA
jgi:hypothetical protein